MNTTSKAVKLSCGKYIYREHVIVRSIIKLVGAVWRVYLPAQKVAHDWCETLAEAKELVDERLDA